MVPRGITYPFRPKSTAHLKPGQFWAVPLLDGRYGCGRVLQIGASQIPVKNRAFFGGLLEWVGTDPPTVPSIAGAGLIKWGVMHIKAITEIGGEILGERALEADGIVLPLLLNVVGGSGTLVLDGAEPICEAKREEWGKYPVLEYWGYDVIQVAANARWCSR
jgi:hypothetical protein